MNVLASVLASRFPLVNPYDFYRGIFGDGELATFVDGPYDSWSIADKAENKGKYTGIVVEITSRTLSSGKPRVLRHTLTDDLDLIDELQHSKNFCLCSPISYAGKTRHSASARFMYALCVELDNLRVQGDKQVGLSALINQWERAEWLPVPTYVVASGNGLHLYWVFERPIPLFPNVVKSLSTYKHELTAMIWNQDVTLDYTPDKIQQESIFQGFRMPGTRTKSGDTVEAFLVGAPVSIKYMNSFVTKLQYKADCGIVEIYKSTLTLARAKELYPEWYERRVVEQQPRRYWDYSKQKGHTGDEMYNWWLRRIRDEAVVGHRYYCCMMLSIYAIKCNIEQDRLECDLLDLLELFEQRTVREDNHFTEKDIMDALQAFEDKSLITYPVTSISNRSGLEIQKNKRNYQKQEYHLEDMRDKKKKMKRRGQPFKRPEGRPRSDEKVIEYIIDHPEEKKSEVARGAGVSRPTVDRYWDVGHERAFRYVERQVYRTIDMIDSVRHMAEEDDDMYDDYRGEWKDDDDYWDRRLSEELHEIPQYDWYMTYMPSNGKKKDEGVAQS